MKGIEVLWVTGGETTDSDEYKEHPDSVTLMSTEFITSTLTTSMPGPDLPRLLMGHCLAKINESSTLLVGGQSEFVTSFDFMLDYYIYTSGWTLMPGLLAFQRFEPACGMVLDSASQQRIVMVTGDNLATGNSVDVETEILFLDHEVLEWTSGPVFPKVAEDVSALTLPSNEKLIVLGTGLHYLDNPENFIYTFQCSSGLCDWILLDQRFEVTRLHPVTMLIPDSMIEC